MTRLAKAVVAALAACVLLALPGEPAWGYMSTRVPTSGNPGVVGKPVRWDLGASRNNVANRRILYEIGASGCADTITGPVDEFEAIQNSFTRWRRIEASELDFEFVTTTTNEITSATDNHNVIRFLGANTTAGVFATTIVSFNTDTGEITDADMEINDRDFTWDTVGESPTTGPIGRAIIENIITHEIGHIAGLDHPNNSQSTMFFSTGSGIISQSTLEHDDIAPIIADYPHSVFSRPELGTVSGTVRSGGVGQFGVAVTLVDVGTGANVIGHVSEKSPVAAIGEYTITGVPPGNYFAVALPVDTSRLGSYYSGAFTNFFPVVAGVDVSAAEPPTIIRVAPGQDVTGVDIVLPNAAADPFAGDDSTAGATLVSSGEVAVSRISPANESDFFKFDAPGARQVRVRVLSDAFGLPLNPTLTLYHPDGATVLASPNFGHGKFMASANDIDGDAFDLSGVNFDAEIVYDLPGAGTYFVQVQSRLGVTSGPYVLTLEISGEDTAADPAASTMVSVLAGLPAGVAASTAVFVTPRNLYGRDLAAPLTFTVDLLDRTGGGLAVLDTLSGQSMPFQFTLNAHPTPGVRVYGMRIDGVVMDATISISHYGTLAPANSRILCTETSLIGNGADEGLILVELRDNANNPFLEPVTVVTVTVNSGMLDNGTDEGQTDIDAVWDISRRAWVIVLRAPTHPANISVSAKAGVGAAAAGSPIIVRALQRATPSVVAPPPEDDDDVDGGGGCTALGNDGWLVIVGLFAVLALRRRNRPLTKAN